MVRLFRKLERYFKLRAIRRLPAHLRGRARFELEYGSRYSYGFASYGLPIVEDWNQGTTLTIGSFCSIAAGVRILLGGGHRLDWVSTYPIPMMFSGIQTAESCQTSKGDVQIGSDVWIGMNAMILSGITIGHGAVVAAGAVVSRDVPPYSVVAGNPARVVKYRFDEQSIKALLESAWWEADEDWLFKNMHVLASSRICEFLGRVNRSES